MDTTTISTEPQPSHCVPVLPDRLKSGELITIKGHTYTVVKTRARDEYGEPLYRLRGYVLSTWHWSRDQLQAIGAVLADEEAQR